jgi:TRAP-type mannitol/chloroaromatic compound transport system substrate-binding protein
MDRREFLITSGGAAVAATSSAAAHAEAVDTHAHSKAGGGIALKLVMPWADTPQGPADSVRRLARRVETMTDHRYRIEVASGADSSEAHLTHGSAHDFATLHPAFAYFAGLPGPTGLAAGDLAHWMTVGGGQMLWDDLAGQHGWKSLLVGHMGEAPPLWSRAPITRLGDLSGQCIAAPGLGADVARALGAEAMRLAPGEVSTALDAGSVYAAEAGGLLPSLASGIPRVARHATGSGLNGRGTALSLNVRLSAWESLSEADQAILEAAAAEEFQSSLAEARAHDRLARRVMESSFGVVFAPWPVDVAEALERVAEATIAHVAGHDTIAARIDQSYMAFRAALSGTIPPRRATPAPIA